MKPDQLDWAEPLIRVHLALKAAEAALLDNQHIEARKQIWIARRALNECENASLDMSPAPIK